MPMLMANLTSTGPPQIDLPLVFKVLKNSYWSQGCAFIFSSKSSNKKRDRVIPSSNMDLHYAHCSRNLEKCKICDEMVPKKHVEEHYLTTHAPVSCSLCNETMEPEILAVHELEKCPQRIMTCDYCEFPLPAIDLFEHQDVCGNRTENCHLCNRYIRLREKVAHDVTCNGVPDDTAETSRTRESERHGDGRRRLPPQELSTRRLVFTIAITGIAVVLGSFLFHRKPPNSELH